MPKPQRSDSEQIKIYKRKIKDLEDNRLKTKRRRRVLVFTSSDDSDVEQGDNHQQQCSISTPPSTGNQSPEGQAVSPMVIESQVAIQVPAQPERIPQTVMEGTSTVTATPLASTSTAPPPPPDATSTAPPPPFDATSTAPPQPPADASSTAPPAAADPTLDPVTATLDPALLAALGESTSDTPEFGPSIHDSLANIWLPLLKKGFNKENKEKVLKQYLIPSNCKLLQAPKLNAEISAAVSDVVRGRDKKYVAVQQQLGQGIAAVNRAMDGMLKTDNKAEALTYLSDAGRILSDLHNFFTKDRIKLITPSLEKNFLHVIQDAERDEFLFGNSLAEKIKASKAIEKQGQQIKKSVSTTKANTPNTSSARPSTSQGNWSGPPRFSSNRGGRGGSRRMNPSPVTRRPYINTAPTARPPPAYKTRAQSHQQ